MFALLILFVHYFLMFLLLQPRLLYYYYLILVSIDMDKLDHLYSYILLHILCCLQLYNYDNPTHLYLMYLVYPLYLCFLQLLLYFHFHIMYCKNHLNNIQHYCILKLFQNKQIYLLELYLLVLVYYLLPLILSNLNFLVLYFAH